MKTINRLPEVILGKIVLHVLAATDADGTRI